jgi:hypothetical protein
MKTDIVNRVTHFKYDYDKKDLLKRIHNLLPKIGVRLVRDDPESNSGGQDCWRIRIDSHLDNSDCLHIYNVCKPIWDAFGCKDHHIRIQHYNSESFLGWHYDWPKDSGITKVNLLLTEQRAFSDKDGNKYEFDTAIVDATTFEHMWDNRGMPDRTFIRIGLQDIQYSYACERLKELNYEIKNTYC